nr:hypothetical protein [Tanacetum cinerariifolium]
MIRFFTLLNVTFKSLNCSFGIIHIDEDLIQSILSGSPLLETLELNSCYGAFSQIDITSKSIKNFVFFAYPGYGVCSMEINAPHIQSLTIQSYRWLHKFLLHDLSSLVKVKLDYKATNEEDAEDEMLKGILLSVRHVKELKIGKQCLQVFSRLEAKGFAFPPGLRLPDDSDSRETDYRHFEPLDPSIGRRLLPDCLLVVIISHLPDTTKAIRTGAISWNKLKSLYIGHMNLDEYVIQNILFRSPLLETLELKFCYGPFTRIDITSKSVTNLVFFGYYNSVYSMEINAPHIQLLTIQTNVRLHNFLLHDVSSLVKAKLDYHNKKWYCEAAYEEDAELEMLKGFLLSLRHVKELNIGNRCLQITVFFNMELYMLNRQHGRMIIESVKNGPLLWPTVEENEVTRPKKYSELSATEAIQADCDVKKTNIILQGLPPEVYDLVSTHKVEKELWERIQMLMQGTSLTKQERECKLYDEFDKFAYKKGESLSDFYLRF